MAQKIIFFASFNVRNIEVWRTEFYLEKKSVFMEIEEAKEEIVERIDDFSIFVDEEKIKKTLECAIFKMKEFGMYKDKKNDLDFFILEQPVWENYEQKNKIENGIIS